MAKSNSSMNVDWNPAAKDILSGAAMRGLTLGAEHVLGEAKGLVPIEEDTLERSGFVSTDPGKLTAAVNFDTPYAVRQHEDLTLQHDPGRQAKYLETPMNTEAEAVREIIARTVAGEF